MGDKKTAVERTVYVGDREIELVCPICGGKTFFERKTLMNTMGATLLGWDFADAEAMNFICEDCSYIYWFMEDPTVSTKKGPGLTKVQEYEITFKKYSDKKLYKVINDEGYNQEAREAARNLLRQRNMPV